MPTHLRPDTSDFEVLFKVILGFRVTWTPKVCRITAFMAVIMGLGLVFLHIFGV